MDPLDTPAVRAMKAYPVRVLVCLIRGHVVVGTRLEIVEHDKERERLRFISAQWCGRCRLLIVYDMGSWLAARPGAIKAETDRLKKRIASIH